MGEMRVIRLNAPDTKRGPAFMEALARRASGQEFAETDLSLQDLSDLLWAANGINRPAVHKYTAPSAQNAHDVDIYVFMKDGAFLYDADLHVLTQVIEGDFRSELMMQPPRLPDRAGIEAPPRPATPAAPVQIILVADTARFRFGPKELRYEWAAIDTGIVSQNIALFCAAAGLVTRARASIDKQKVKDLLDLSDAQYVFLNHPVGYPK